MLKPIEIKRIFGHLDRDPRAVADVVTDNNDDTIPVVVVPCEVYSRVVGYYRPVSGWNEGKRQEFEDRKVNYIKGFKEVLTSQILHNPHASEEPRRTP